MSRGRTARIIASSDKGLQVCAASARMSTKPGTALELFSARGGDQKDQMLVGKVLASGHKSLIEHHTFTIAFDNVSVLAEQFLIESRLSSFTVKSRRYVDFEKAGFYLPDGLDAGLRDQFARAAQARFDDYAFLTKHGVALEDARFVLPYCFSSNFYMTLNARELLLIIDAMLRGRGSAFDELRALGAQLSEQFDAFYPGIIESENAHRAGARPAPLPSDLQDAHRADPFVQLIGTPTNAPALLGEAMAFTGRYAEGELGRLTRDARARELEMLHYTFKIGGISLSCITHFARHRMQSPLFPPVLTALAGGGYVLPERIRALGGDVQARYENAFRENTTNARALRAGGLSNENLSYLALSGMTTDIMLTMNARELMHFMKLRTCERAQWETRGHALQMLRALQTSFPALFCLYGPSCAVDGRCPEGRLSCGHTRSLPLTIE